ncbi:MAG: mechanosensitive ion channel [Limnospira sp. PMC 1291.21]|uniref:Mechanosensitive ion channel domain-containing protein n=1 Tax=Limnospira fusiformis PMC 851.14 TaxID=2219512 RepID=A0ABU9EN74_LIMFS|nr:MULTISPECIES: mechanosensitive ion channel domain-containing protein [Limnospira]EKD05858.1 mechanosensitive ion channel [Arthrospira platensis C1]MDY7051081.1 mechanosensitive ion channel [Limnospira fusiformis LS22]QJB27063.1 mechanosensitive ion channel [Limnospira fusiformis SAG 85.79]MDT9179523.1 mechanosensitive ion channel [Limnospira sp. PMC 1238.20]MDT9190655.1 mechanosensitive ion channel [Limnospira sp. PMC 894.15]
MVETTSDAIVLGFNPLLKLVLVLLGLISALMGLWLLPKLWRMAIAKLIPEERISSYSEILSSYKIPAAVAVLLVIIEIIWVNSPLSIALGFLEVIISLSLTILLSWLASQIFKRFFDLYIIDVASKQGRNINSEFLLVGKILANCVIILVAIVVFAQTHQINIVGLIASLGVGGLAVAFAAQNTLSQILGGIVLYLDRPFVVDDYIGLPDGTFGRVESLGLRSTKIRTSGKGTIVIVPNSSLTQLSIENYTGARKIISILGLTFHSAIDSEEQALIRQVILESTKNTFGIDPRGTDVSFKNLQPITGENKTQAQVTFFILGANRNNLELRRQMLDLASQDISMNLQQYGIAFDIEDQNIYVDSPITV